MGISGHWQQIAKENERKGYILFCFVMNEFFEFVWFCFFVLHNYLKREQIAFQRFGHYWKDTGRIVNEMMSSIWFWITPQTHITIPNQKNNKQLVVCVVISFT